MREAIYSVNDRVSFMAWTTDVENGVALDVLKHFVGYVKQVRRGRLNIRYAINVAKSDEMYVVDEKDIFGIAEKKEYKQPKSTQE